MDRVKVKLGRKVVSYNDEQLKSDLDLSTSLSAEKINEVAKETREKLSALTQPVYPHDIAAAAHFTLVEMGLKDEGNKYMSFLKKRRDNRFVPNVECHYIDCQICGVANSPENEKCSGCGALLDGKKIIFKAV